MNYFDGDGNIIVPKSVRPIIEYEETGFGSKKYSIRQYRYENLHIREYDDYYSIHMDKIDPRIDPAGHLLIDAPEYLISSILAIIIGSTVSKTYCRKYNKNRQYSQLRSLINGLKMGIVAGTATFVITQQVFNQIKKFWR